MFDLVADAPSRWKRLLEVARWAPSGDNLQPWRFEVVHDDRLLVHLAPKIPDNVYDVNSHPSLLSLGCLVECLRLAAAQEALDLRWRYQPSSPALKDQGGTLFVELVEAPQLEPDALFAHIRSRSVNRFPYQTRALTAEQKAALQAAVGPEFTVTWFEHFAERLELARLNRATGHIRMTTAEIIPVYQRIVDWSGALESTDRIPLAATGVGKLGQRLMRWVLAQRQRAEFLMCTLPGGTLSSELELELLPGCLCAAHFMLTPVAGPEQPTHEATALIRAGQAVQRLWLTAERCGLALQPSFATIAFAWYGRNLVPFSANPNKLPMAKQVSRRLTTLAQDRGIDASQILFMGRLGTPHQPPVARSTRKPLNELLGPRKSAI